MRGRACLLLAVLLLGCGQVRPTIPPATIPGVASPAPLATPAAQTAAPIILGTEYVTIENENRVSTLAQVLAPIGLTAAKPLPENFSWGEMQRSPEAPLDFRRLDRFVREFQEAGFRELVLALKPHSPWASKSYPGEGLFPLKGGVKPEYLDAYDNWIFSVVERYDADGGADMPGLLYPVRFYEIGTEFSSYEPEPVEEYLVILERAYSAAHRADDDVIVAHAAFLTTLAFSGNPQPDEYEAAFEEIPDRTHSLADMRGVLDRPDVFDVLNVHSLGDPYEIEAIVAWLNYEMGERDYQKRIIISDTATTPFISWGPATACDRAPNLMGQIIPPATEADRCRLADYFTNLVNGDEATVRWTQGFAAQDMVKKVVVSAEQGILLINTAFTEDLIWLKWPIAQAGAGTSAWAGLISLEPREKRAGFHALQQVIRHLQGCESINRLAFDDVGIRAYELRCAGRRTWIAWYDPGRLLLPGDPLPETTVSLEVSRSAVSVESLITQFGQQNPGRETVPAQAGVVVLTLTPTPVFITAS